MIATATLGGKAGRTASTLPLFEAAEALLEEALAPLADDLSRGVQPGGNLVVAEPFRSVEYDPGPDDLSIVDPATGDRTIFANTFDGNGPGFSVSSFEMELVGFPIPAGVTALSGWGLALLAGLVLGVSLRIKQGRRVVIDA